VAVAAAADWRDSVERKVSAECEQGVGEKEQMEEVEEAAERVAEAGSLYFLLSLEKTLRPRWRIWEAEEDIIEEVPV